MWLVFACKLEYEKAAADLDAALALDPTNKNATKYRAIVAERMGEKEVSFLSAHLNRSKQGHCLAPIEYAFCPKL